MDTDFDERFSDASDDSEDFDATDSGWKEQPGDAEMLAFSQCLFCAEEFGAADALLLHCSTVHSFNLLGFASQLHLDCFGFIKLVNFIRKEKPTIDQLNDIFNQHASASYPYPWNEDQFLQPIDQADLLLQYDYEDQVGCSAAFRNVGAEAEQCIQQQEILIEQLQDALRQLRADGAQNLLCAVADTPVQSVSSEMAAHSIDESYFDSYDHFGIHAEMLKDKIRTEAYLQAVQQNSSTFSGKRVLDVGCGTGILSLIAARFGSARHVTAVDFSDIAFAAMDIVRENKLEDTVTVLHTKVEDLVDEEKFDVIISEWMGYFLLFESMLDSVLYARDHLLKPDGKVLPDIHNLYIVGASGDKLIADHVEFWNDVYGFQMSCMKSWVIKEASTVQVEAESVCTEPSLLRAYDLNDRSLTVSNAVPFCCEFALSCKGGTVRMLVAYFDTAFTAGCEQKVSFSTAPDKPPTHWKQTVFPLLRGIDTVAGEKLCGKMVVKKAVREPRCLSVDILIDGQKLHYTVS